MFYSDFSHICSSRNIAEFKKQLTVVNVCFQQYLPTVKIYFGTHAPYLIAVLSTTMFL